MSAELLSAAAGWLHFAGLTGVLGAVTARWALLGAALPGGARASLRPQAARTGLAASGLLAVGLGLVLVRQLLEFRDPFVPWTEDLALLLSTPWGGAWRWAAAGALLLPLAFAAALRLDRAGWVAGTLLALLLAAFPPFTGHAAAAEPRTWTLAADWIHVAAAGAWVGTLAVLLLLAGAGRASPTGIPGGAASPGDGGEAGEGDVLPILVARFSPVAMGAVALLAATGLFASGVHVGGWARLWGTPYGRILVLKVVLVAGVVALGATNHLRWRPLLGEASGREGLRRWVYWEVVLGAAVLAVTAVLVRTSPM